MLQTPKFLRMLSPVPPAPAAPSASRQNMQRQPACGPTDSSAARTMNNTCGRHQAAAPESPALLEGDGDADDPMDLQIEVGHQTKNLLPTMRTLHGFSFSLPS